jgi:hypothetical protein
LGEEERKNSPNLTGLGPDEGECIGD